MCGNANRISVCDVFRTRFVRVILSFRKYLGSCAHVSVRMCEETYVVLNKSSVYLASCARSTIKMCAETYVVLKKSPRIFSELRTIHHQDVRRNLRGSQ